MYAKRKCSYRAETVKKGQHICEVLYHHFMSNGRGVMVQKPLFTDGQKDRQTAMVKPVYLHNFVSGGIQTYLQCREIVEK